MRLTRVDPNNTTLDFKVSLEWRRGSQAASNNPIWNLKVDSKTETPGTRYMKIIVTGGAGFIGSALIRYLIEKTDSEVLNLDALTYAGNLDSLLPVSDSNKYQFSHTNILDRPKIQKVFETFQPEVVLHLAAESHVDRSIDGPGIFLQTNIIGTFELLSVATDFWTRLAAPEKDKFRFVHVSTDEVYGDLEDSSSFFTEKTPYAPSSPYSASKASSDHLARAWYRTYGLPTIITNCSNNYGPYQFPEKLIPHMILNAMNSKPLPVYGNGQQIRDWLYVEDHARALWMVAETGVCGETYNIGGHNEKANIDVVYAICNLLTERIDSKVPLQDLITFVKDRPGHDTRYAIDASKIHAELGWVPVETFESGIAKTIDWYLENTHWWARILDGSYQLNRLGN